MYEPRTYRHWIKDADLTSFNVTVKETDLWIRARRRLTRKALKSVLKHRRSIESYIERRPEFATTLEPIEIDATAPRIVREMGTAANAVSLGPMAAVAGAIAEAVGHDLLDFSPEVIVENGGDIFLKCTRNRLVGIYAGSSPLSGRIAIEIDAPTTPLGICTSSGTVGHSLSLGTADAVVILSASTVLADAVATATGNMVRDAADFEGAILFASAVPGVKGAMLIKGERIGAWGEIRIVPVD